MNFWATRMHWYWSYRHCVLHKSSVSNDSLFCHNRYDTKSLRVNRSRKCFLFDKTVHHSQIFNTIFCTSRTRMSFVVLLWANWFIKVLILYGNFRRWFRELFFYFSHSVWCNRFVHFHQYHLQMTFVVGHVARCRNVLVSDFEGFLPSSEPHYMGLECHLRRRMENL